MAGTNDSSRVRRVIALLPAGSAFEANGSVHLVHASSGYEAAVELLSGPASALLVNLARLTAAHTALLNLAGKLEVPVVAFGTVSSALDGAALAGVRLVGAEQVAETLSNLVAAPSGDEPATAGEKGKSRQAKTPRPERPEQPEAAPPQLAAETLTGEELDTLLRDGL